MFVSVNDRVYNLATVGIMEGDGFGAVDMRLPGGSLKIAFSDTSIENPVRKDVLVELIQRAGNDLGLLTWADVEEFYRDELARQDRRAHIRARLS